MNRKVVAVAGPTASGKSALAMELAKRFDGEIVCCDSMQIYRDMNIGTAKPTAEERAEVRHHMVDFLDPDTKYSCADYTSDAKLCIDDVLSRGKLPVICGGTGLYLDSLLYERPYSESCDSGKLREELENEAKEKGSHFLWEKLRAVDPGSAAQIHENNMRRVARALEIYMLTGRKKSELDSLPRLPVYDSLTLILHTSDRTVQNKRIETRVDRMIEDGLTEETRALMQKGVFDCNGTAAQAIGYKEMLGYLRSEDTLSEAREKLIIATRQYAKRQDTWFSGLSYGHKIELGEEFPDPLETALALVSDFLKR